MNHGEIADARFHEGCNCAQAVFTAFCDVTGLSRPEAMRLSSSFGGGVGRMREICGALSGAFLVLGWRRFRQSRPLRPGPGACRRFPKTKRLHRLPGAAPKPGQQRRSDAANRGVLSQPSLRPVCPGHRRAPGPVHPRPSSGGRRQSIKSCCRETAVSLQQLVSRAWFTPERFRPHGTEAASPDTEYPPGPGRRPRPKWPYVRRWYRLLFPPDSPKQTEIRRWKSHRPQ